MKNILLFGSSTKTGQHIKRIYNQYFQNISLYGFSRKKKDNYYFNLESLFFPEEMKVNKDFYIISLAPIWLFVPFIENYLETYSKSLIKGIIVTSSTSSITKKFSWNKYDKNLTRKLLFWENKLIELQKKYDLNVCLIRPTLIYGDIGEKQDKNISILLKVMRNLPFLPIPRNTGMRQPIHYSQLAECILKVIENINKNTQNSKKLEILNLGGDDELTYFEILKRIKINCPKKDMAKKCLIIKIPNRIFIFLCMPILLFSPKFFEALERLVINLNGFKRSHEISGKAKNLFPVKVKISKNKNA